MNQLPCMNEAFSEESSAEWKKAANCWNAEIDTFLLSNGHKKCGADPCVYIVSVKRKNGKIDFVIFYLYVDDITWFSNNTKMLKEKKLALAKRSKVEDLIDVQYRQSESDGDISLTGGSDRSDGNRCLPSEKCLSSGEL